MSETYKHFSYYFGTPLNEEKLFHSWFVASDNIDALADTNIHINATFIVKEMS